MSKIELRKCQQTLFLTFKNLQNCKKRINVLRIIKTSLYSHLASTYPTLSSQQIFTVSERSEKPIQSVLFLLIKTRTTISYMIIIKLRILSAKIKTVFDQ